MTIIGTVTEALKVDSTVRLAGARGGRINRHCPVWRLQHGIVKVMAFAGFRVHVTNDIDPHAGRCRPYSCTFTVIELSVVRMMVSSATVGIRDIHEPQREERISDKDEPARYRI